MALGSIHASKLTSFVPEGGVYYLKGTDPYWLDEGEKFFKNLLPEDSLSLRILDKITSVYAIFSAFDTICFGEEKTVVIVKDNDFNPGEKDHNALLSFLQTPIAPNFLVFCNSGFLTTAETKLCQIVECSPLDKFSCAEYVDHFFPSGIEKNAVQALLDKTGCDMAKIANEAKKLNAYAENTLISLEDVENLVSEDTETTVFLFTNSIIEGKMNQAEKQLNNLLKKGEKPAMLLSILSNQFRRMLYCCLTPYDTKTMAQLLGIKEFAVEKARKVKGYTQAKLKEYTALIAEYEYKFKSGVMSDESAFSSVVAKLLSKEVV